LKLRGKQKKKILDLFVIGEKKNLMTTVAERYVTLMLNFFDYVRQEKELEKRIQEKKKVFNEKKWSQDLQDYAFHIHQIQQKIKESLSQKGYNVIWKTDDQNQTYTHAMEWQHMDQDGLPFKQRTVSDYVKAMLSIIPACDEETYTTTFYANFHRILTTREHDGSWKLYFALQKDLNVERIRKELEIFEPLLLELEISYLLTGKKLKIEWVEDEEYAENFPLDVDWQVIENYKPIRQKTAQEYVDEIVAMIPKETKIQAKFRFVECNSSWVLSYLPVHQYTEVVYLK